MPRAISGVVSREYHLAVVERLNRELDEERRSMRKSKAKYVNFGELTEALEEEAKELKFQDFSEFMRTVARYWLARSSTNNTYPREEGVTR